MRRAVAGTSVFVAREAGRPLDDPLDEIAVSVVTAAVLELAVLRAQGPTDPGGASRKLRRHDTWIAASAMRHRAEVVTQDADFTDFDLVRVIRV